MRMKNFSDLAKLIAQLHPSLEAKGPELEGSELS
jgi:hypothetical protein